jgi:hypothetical protein
VNGDAVHHYDNNAFEAEPPMRVSAECAEVLRIKAEAGAGRQRTMSQSSDASVSSFFRVKNLHVVPPPERTRTLSGSSVHSGAGPVHLSGPLPHVTDEDAEVHGIGGYMTGAMTPTGKRKDYQNVRIARL